MISASEIRELARNYLSGALNIQQFAENFENQYSEINIACDLEALSLGDRIQALLGRVSAGYASERDFQEWLVPLSREPLSVNMFIGFSSSFPASVNHFAVGEIAFPASGVSGTSPGVVFGSALCLPV